MLLLSCLFVLRSRPRYELFLITIFICTLILFHIFVDIYSSKPDQSNTYDQKQNRRHDHNKLFITMTCGNRPEHLVCQCEQIKPGHCINRQSCIFLPSVILRIIFVALQFLAVSQNMQYVIKGLIILIACAIDMRKYLVRK